MYRLQDMFQGSAKDPFYGAEGLVCEIQAAEGNARNMTRANNNDGGRGQTNMAVASERVCVWTGTLVRLVFLLTRPPVVSSVTNRCSFTSTRSRTRPLGAKKGHL